MGLFFKVRICFQRRKIYSFKYSPFCSRSQVSTGKHFIPLGSAPIPAYMIKKTCDSHLVLIFNAKHNTAFLAYKADPNFMLNGALV